MENDEIEAGEGAINPDQDLVLFCGCCPWCEMAMEPLDTRQSVEGGDQSNATES